MARTSGGNILVEMLLRDKKYRAGLAKAASFAQKQAGKIGSFFRNASGAIDQVGGRAVEQAERFTFLAGAIFAPITLSIKSFADANETAKQKIAELIQKRNQLKPAQIFEKEQINEDIKKFESIAKETEEAAKTQKDLIKTFKDLNFEIARVLFQTLQPYIRNIIDTFKATIVWIKANQETARSIALLVAKAGALFAALAPILAIGGKLIRVLALLASPIGFLAFVFFGLYQLFKNQINPILEEHSKKITNLFNDWKNGSVSTEQAINQLSDQLLIFAGKTLISIGEQINKTVDDWTKGWVNTLVEEIFFWIIRTIDNASEAWNDYWTNFSKVVQQAWKNIMPIFNSIKNLWDKTIGAILSGEQQGQLFSAAQIAAGNTGAALSAGFNTQTPPINSPIQGLGNTGGFQNILNITGLDSTAISRIKQIVDESNEQKLGIFAQELKR